MYSGQQSPSRDLEEGHVSLNEVAVEVRCILFNISGKCEEGGYGFANLF